MDIITKPKVEIAPDLLKKMQTEVEEKGQVVLHIFYRVPSSNFMQIRIWPTTFLYDSNSSHKSDLVTYHNIVLYPHWHLCFPGENVYFTLVFNGLPKSCTSFDFIEHCDNEAGAFKVTGIARNESDVYYLRIN